MNPRIFKVLLFLPFIIFYIAKFENISAQENINANDNNLFLKNKKGKKKEKLKIRYDDIKNILINNNVDLKRYKSRVNQSKALLKSNKAAWYPKINVSSDQLPNFVTGDSINESSNNTSTNRLSFGVSTTFEWDLINPSRRLNISLANQDLDNNNLSGDIPDTICDYISDPYNVINIGDNNFCTYIPDCFTTLIGDQNCE